MDKITSRNNPRVKYMVSLSRPQGRKKTGEVLLEGKNLVEEAVQKGIELLEVFMTEEFYEREKINFATKMVLVPEDVLKKIATTKTSPGIVARIKPERMSWKEVQCGKRLLILDGLKDPGNVGTLLRTAAGGGIEGVILLNHSADPWQNKVLRATAGTIFEMKVAEVLDEEKKEFFKVLEHNWKIYLADPNKGRDFREVDFSERSVLVLGHETKGISSDFYELVHERVTVPLQRGIESLNVAAAGAILIYGMQQNVL